MMLPYVRLVPNSDGTFDIYLEYGKNDTEFAREWSEKGKDEISASLLQTIRAHAGRARIRSIKIFASGVLVSTAALSSFLPSFAAGDHFIMGYLYQGTEQQYYEYVNQAGSALDTVSPNYFNIAEDGSLVLNHPNSSFIAQMQSRGLKVVPFLSNHWNRSAGINALKDVEALSSQIAAYVEEYNLDGINVDIENVTHEQKDQYTELIRLLREKLPEGKELSVAVAANPENWQAGWHGSYDYAALAGYADYLMLMAYDEHYEGGTPGPVASLSFVERSIQQALTFVSPDKLVLGIPFYGRIWSLDSSRIVGKGAAGKIIQDIIHNTEADVSYDETAQAVRAEFTITESSPQYTVGGDFVLLPGRYTAWFDDSRSYQAKLSLIEKYNLKGAGSWALGQEDPSIWAHYEDWMGGGSSGTEIPEISPEVPDTEEPDAESFTYEVKKGDTLWKIAQKLLGDGNRYPEIIVLNGLTSETIYPGMQLQIPGTSGSGQTGKPESSGNSGSSGNAGNSGNTGNSGNAGNSGNSGNINASTRTYTVRAGDTLWKIAEAQLGSGRRYTEIVELNQLNGDTIYTGQVLRIPKK